MAGGAKWSTGKIVLVAFLAVALLGALCCGAFLWMGKDVIRSTVGLVKRSADFQAALQDEVGAGGRARFVVTSPGSWTLVVGVDDEVPEEGFPRVEEAAWRAFARAFPDDAPPVRFVTVGRSTPGEGEVSLSGSRAVEVEELVERTGVEAPPASEALSTEGVRPEFGVDW